jgi:Rrf2 family protein
MQLTRAADYAVRVMTHLASVPVGTVVSKSVLAKASDAPESFLAKILQSLTRAGLIEARRGVEGGFLLLERGARASLLDVVESIDGPISLNICLNADVSCPRTNGCAAHQVWRRAQEAMLTVLREAKIAEMVDRQGRDGGLTQVSELACSGKREAGRTPSPGTPAARSKQPAGPCCNPFGALRESDEENFKKS